MPREGTRSQTGNAKPRVFSTVETAPVIKRAKATAAKVTGKSTKPAAKPKTAKPTGVTKKPKATKPVTKVKMDAKKAAAVKT